jgi:hypothetical protein
MWIWQVRLKTVAAIKALEEPVRPLRLNLERKIPPRVSDTSMMRGSFEYNVIRSSGFTAGDYFHRFYPRRNSGEYFRITAVRVLNFICMILVICKDMDFGDGPEVPVPGF